MLHIIINNIALLRKAGAPCKRRRRIKCGDRAGRKALRRTGGENVKMSGKDCEKMCACETNAGVYFKKISERLRTIADRKGIKHDVTYAQGKILYYLHEKKAGGATMKEIETYLDVSHATVSGIISRLAEKGYVTCEKSTSDARAKTVRLTEKEMDSFSEMKKRKRDLENMLLNGFSKEEIEILLSYLDRIYGNVKAAEEKECRAD